ncbi:hypothetical protein GQ602_007102 [Ophiocordyceps camponoti-floridani]|uniref:Uncharacterized protein n=1 Tax=Ophiocordyceps camponoti-floridani TaxID=2030778 RepID=A0A8H4Q0R3_9HYPO|nr:hypothetical protein GQ602_007102 [Ophiocordyceps camponoti-floridani]
MAPIPVYSASPINAASGSNRAAEGHQDDQRPTKPTSTAHGLDGWQNAQPGAVPALPTATGVPPPAPAAAIPSRVQPESPAGPQPGAVPVPPGLPPPPKAGETAAAPKQHPQAPPQTSTPPRLPPQLSYQPPPMAPPIQGRSSTAPMAPGPHMYPASVPSAGGYASSMGYQQGTQPAYSGSDHPPPQQSYGFPNSTSTSSHAEGDAEAPGVWDTARRWASAAGESLAAAESEVWKRINKS